MVIEALIVWLEMNRRIIVNSESNILNSNKCCDDTIVGNDFIDATCRTASGPGTANEDSPEGRYYSVRLRPFATFQRTTISINVDILLVLLSSTGSFVTVLMLVMATIAKIWRKISINDFEIVRKSQQILSRKSKEVL